MPRLRHEQEINYNHLDDGRAQGYARLKRSDQRVVSSGEVSRCGPQHIHSVWNVGKEISISLHTYGRHINYTGRSEFDPEKNLEKPYVIKVARDVPPQS